MTTAMPATTLLQPLRTLLPLALPPLVMSVLTSQTTASVSTSLLLVRSISCINEVAVLITPPGLQIKSTYIGSKRATTTMSGRRRFTSSAPGLGTATVALKVAREATDAVPIAKQILGAAAHIVEAAEVRFPLRVLHTLIG